MAKVKNQVSNYIIYLYDFLLKKKKIAKGVPKKVVKKRVLDKENYDTSNIVKKSR